MLTTFLQCADVHFRRRAMTRAKQDIRADVRRDNAREAKREAAAQELSHETFKVAIRADACAMIRVKDFVIRADGDDVELIPDVLALFGRHGTDRAVVVRQRAAEVFEQDVGEFPRQARRTLAARLDAKGPADRSQFLFPKNRELQPPFGNELHREQDLAGMRAVLGRPGRRAAHEVARDDDVSIRTANAARRFRRDLARAHVAVLAADACEAERTLRLLLVKPIKHRITAELLHAQQHLAHSGIRRMIEHVLLARKRLAIRGNGLHVVGCAAMRVRVRIIVLVRLPIRMLMRMRMVMWMLVCVFLRLVCHHFALHNL